METYKKKIWSNEDNLKLIALYETMPELWHQSDPSYKEISKKRESMEKLTKTFDTNIHEMRRRLHNIRAQFSSELRRLKLKSLRLNIPPSEVKSEWKYFHKLGYLMVNYPSFYSFDINERNEESSTDASYNSQIYKKKNSQSDEDKTDSDDDNRPSSSKRLVPKAEEVFIPEEYQLVNKKTNVSDEDHRIFGEYVASELRHLSKKAALKLKLKIKRAILEVTEEEYHKDNEADCLQFR